MVCVGGVFFVFFFVGGLGGWVGGVCLCFCFCHLSVRVHGCIEGSTI